MHFGPERSRQLFLQKQLKRPGVLPLQALKRNQQGLVSVYIEIDAACREIALLNLPIAELRLRQGAVCLDTVVKKAQGDFAARGAV